MPSLTRPLTRRFHVGDLLAVVTGVECVSPRGVPGVQALVAYMTRYAAFALDGADGFDRCERALRDAVLAAYPELGAYAAADVPPPELLAAWRRRRAQEFGRYLVAPVLPPTHPLLTGPAADRAVDPLAARRAAGDRARAGGVAEAAGEDATAGRADPAGGATDDATEGATARAADPPAGGAGSTGSRLRRRFHVGDLLAVTTRRIDVAPRGDAGVVALVRYMADRPLTGDDMHGRGEAFRAALLAAYPELGAFTAADVPPPELLPLWRRRREREFGRYLVVPRLPITHPLRAAPQATVAVAPATATVLPAPPPAMRPAQMQAHGRGPRHATEPVA